MLITNINGKPVNLVSPGQVSFTIDDVATNVFKEAKLLSVTEPGTLKVTFENGKTAILENYDNFPLYFVTKVWDTDTTLDHSKIKLSE